MQKICFYYKVTYNLNHVLKKPLTDAVVIIMLTLHMAFAWVLYFSLYTKLCPGHISVTSGLIFMIEKPSENIDDK